MATSQTTNCKTTRELITQAQNIERKARRIKLPLDKYPDSRVEYLIHPGVGKITGVDVVKNNLPVGNNTRQKDYFDLSVSRKFASYDKQGGKIVVKAVKRYVLWNEKVRTTRERCDAFFSDENNFDL